MKEKLWFWGWMDEQTYTKLVEVYELMNKRLQNSGKPKL